MNLSSVYHKLDGSLATLAGWVQPLLLLLIRGWWGWSFLLTGKGKLLHLDRTATFFAELNIPFPQLNALMAGTTECLGGLLLLLGLGSRLASVPLIFTMLVAYATADQAALQAVFTDTDKFTGATPFLFLFACLIIFTFGPGKVSLDTLLTRKSVK